MAKSAVAIVPSKILSEVIASAPTFALVTAPSVILSVVTALVASWVELIPPGAIDNAASSKTDFANAFVPFTFIIPSVVTPFVLVIFVSVIAISL